MWIFFYPYVLIMESEYIISSKSSLISKLKTKMQDCKCMFYVATGMRFSWTVI